MHSNTGKKEQFLFTFSFRFVSFIFFFLVERFIERLKRRKKKARDMISVCEINFNGWTLKYIHTHKRNQTCWSINNLILPK